MGKQERIKRSNESLLDNNAAKLREISQLEAKREQIRELLQNPTEGSFERALSEYQELDKSYRELDDEAYQQIEEQVDERSQHLSRIYKEDDAVLSRNADRDNLLESLYRMAPEGEKLRVIKIATPDFKSRKITDIISDPSIRSYDQLKSTLVGTTEDKKALAESCNQAWKAQENNVNAKLIVFINTIVENQEEYSPSKQVSLMVTDEDIENMVNSMTQMLEKSGGITKYKDDAIAMMEKIAKREEKKIAWE